MQDEQVYQWTFDLFPLTKQPMIPLSEAQFLVQHVWFFYKGASPAPLVWDVPERNDSATGSRWAIRLPKWALCKSIVLHEVAHSLSIDDITNHSIDPGYDGHGPLYVRLVMDLYAMFMGMPRTHMLERAAHFGVEVA